MDLKNKDLFIFDLDGVIYLGKEQVPGAKEIIENLGTLGKKVYFVTNNSTQTRLKFREKLLQMDIDVREDQIITSAYATAQYLRNQDPKARVFIIGEIGLVSEFIEAEFRIISVEDKSESVQFVVVGLDRHFDYKKLAFALNKLENGAKFIATNDDPTLPTEHGNLPGAGAMVGALSRAAYREPMITIGKPNTYMVDLILAKENIQRNNAVIIGDRYTTDILAGINAGIGTILVKTGAGEKELSFVPSEGPMPDLILETVAELQEYL